MDKKGVGGVAVLLLVGVFAGGMGGGTALAHNGAVQENVQTTGAVQSTDVDVKVTTDDDGNEERKYRPVITYEYTVDGETYTHDNVFPGSFTRWRGSSAWAERVAGAYSSGQEIAVHYNPRDNTHAYIRDDGLPGGWVLGAGYAVLAFAAGLWLVYVGFKRRKQRALMNDTPTEQVESLSMGPSELTGVAVTEDHAAETAPFTDDKCVVAEWEIEEYDDSNGDDDPGGWQTVETGLRTTPFYVDDGTGTALVRPHEDATYELAEEDWTTVEVDSSNDGPAPVRQFVERNGIGYPTGGSGRDGDRRYKQNLIEPAEDVYVFGTVQPHDGATGTSNADNLVIEKVGEDDSRMEPMFMIADEPEQELVSDRRWALWRLPVGVFFTVLSVGLLLGILGPMVGITLPIPPQLL